MPLISPVPVHCFSIFFLGRVCDRRDFFLFFFFFFFFWGGVGGWVEWGFGVSLLCDEDSNGEPTLLRTGMSSTRPAWNIAHIMCKK